MGNKTYDRIKFIALLITPIITFICALINIWGIPYGDKIIASLSALDVLVGAIVVIAKQIYDKNVESKMGVYGDGSDVNE